MSLNYNLEKIKDFKKKCFVKRNDGTEMTAITHQMIWGLMGIGIDRITEKNAPEVYARLTVNARLYGAPLQKIDDGGNREDVFISPQNVLDHVGLTTNVTTLGRKKWLARIERDLDRYANDYHEKIAVECGAR